MAAEDVQQNQPLGISVIIAGAGVGGLMAALECWRIGCDVRVFDRAPENVTTGDSFSIGKSAINSFRNWPWMERRNADIVRNPLFSIHDETGNLKLGPLEPAALISNEGGGEPFWRHSRPRFHDMQLKQLERIGLAVEYNSEVRDYFEDALRGISGVILKDGSRHEANLVVAADGVRGASWSLIAGCPVPARSSGSAVFRTAYPIDLAMADAAVAERFKLGSDGREVSEMWLGPGVHALITRTPDSMEWIINHPDDESATESWNQKVNPAEVVKHTSTLPGWPAVADRLIMTTPSDRLINWRLMWRDPRRIWTSPGGLVVQLGDAAHTFLPSSGNGATQAIDDAVSLARCITLAGAKSRLPDATRVHNLLRFERVSCLQAFGVLNQEKGQTAEGDSRARAPHFAKWMIEHDAEHYATANYQKALAHIKTGVPFENTNIPPGMQYRDWTIDDLLKAQQEGKPTVLDGDWD